MGAEGPHFFSFTCYQQIERKQSPAALPATRCPFAKRSERDLSCHAPWLAFEDFHGEVGEKGAKCTFLILTEMLFMVVLVLTHTRGLCLNFPCFAIYPLKITCLCTWGTWTTRGAVLIGLALPILENRWICDSSWLYGLLSVGFSSCRSFPWWIFSLSSISLSFLPSSLPPSSLFPFFFSPSLLLSFLSLSLSFLKDQ